MNHKKLGLFLMMSSLLFSLATADAYEAFLGPTGVLRWNKSKAYNGYTLFAPSYNHPQMQPNGNITVFDNGTFRPTGNYSRVLEMDPNTGKIVWQFTSRVVPRYGNTFNSPFQSAAQKLPNGNFLITSTNWGHMFEVTQAKEVVWEYINPINTKGPNCTKDDFEVTFEVHRSYRYAADYPGLKGKDLTPKGPLAPGCPDMRKIYEEATAKNPKK